MDGVRPSSATAPSIWYADVATPHLNDGGRPVGGSSRRGAPVAVGFMVLLAELVDGIGTATAPAGGPGPSASGVNRLAASRGAASRRPCGSTRRECRGGRAPG